MVCECQTWTEFSYSEDWLIQSGRVCVCEFQVDLMSRCPELLSLMEKSLVPHWERLGLGLVVDERFGYVLGKDG